MPERRFHSITLGCKLNRFDSAAIEGELSRRGYSPEPDPARASVVVVNTCTVTGKADSEARKIIRSVRRKNPDCKLLVTGCYAELDAGAIHAIPGVDLVFGNKDKTRFPEILDEIGLTAAGKSELSFDLHFGDRSRAFLKVQEGCDLACSYCIIPTVRGKSRSVPIIEIEKSLSSLVEAGYTEIVLTGVNTGDYGKDFGTGEDLADLLHRLLDREGGYRIRINSLEPLCITDRIIDLFATHPGLAPHIQIPLQSGSDDILRKMRRNYRRTAYIDRIERLRSAVPDIGLGADVIVGFPGETDEQFEETYDLISGSTLNYLHVFAWSPRPGTPASDMSGRVHGRIIKERSARLRGLADRIGFRFRERFTGRSLQAVVLGDTKDGSAIRALTGNYIEVLLEPGSARRRELLEVRITEVSERKTRAIVER